MVENKPEFDQVPSLISHEKLIDVKQKMQSLLYKIVEGLEDVGDDQARLTMMARMEAAMGHEEICLKVLQPPSKIKPKGRPRGTGRLPTANELLNKQIREQEKLHRKRRRLNSQNDSQTSLEKKSQKASQKDSQSEENRRPFKKLRLIVNPPSS
ncbi:hypothetical protein VTP01DRAFT_8071 [Rhizomucor pusillus]|uniref:uncharacterized protein n=1 Tax=Rhizomucor pusillus TaxID=4840 RepID=UPI0037447BCD